MQNYFARYYCLNHCPGAYSLDTIIYNCPTCGDLLEVRHDLDALKQTSAAEWKEIFQTKSDFAPF